MKIQTLKLHGFFFFAWFGCPSESNPRRIFHNISFVHQIPGMVRKDERLRFEDIPLHDIYKFNAFYLYVYKNESFWRDAILNKCTRVQEYAMDTCCINEILTSKTILSYYRK